MGIDNSHILTFRPLAIPDRRIVASLLTATWAVKFLPIKCGQKDAAKIAAILFAFGC